MDNLSIYSDNHRKINHDEGHLEFVLNIVGSACAILGPTKHDDGCGCSRSISSRSVALSSTSPSAAICTDVELLALLAQSSSTDGVWTHGQAAALALDLDRGS